MSEAIDRLQDALYAYLKETEDEDMLTSWVLIYETTSFEAEDEVINGIEVVSPSTTSPSTQLGLMRMGAIHIERNLYNDEDD